MSIEAFVWSYRNGEPIGFDYDVVQMPAMNDSTSYAPFFKGKLPADVPARWKLVRQFIDRWCMSGAAPLLDRSQENTSLIETASALAKRDLSQSIRQWLSLAEEAGNRGAPEIRDCLMVEPIENHFDDPSAKDATVILMQGEGDVFWTVRNDRLTEDDPPVDVFQCFDKDSPAYWLRYPSVSEFVIAYLLTYNSFAARCREWFSANGDAEDIGGVRKWFDYSLVITSEEPYHGGDPYRFCEFLEKENVAAIVSRRRVEVSVFCEPSSLDMPLFLRREMEEHLKVREEWGCT